jgi:GNAT superfamily N-acetyltransferase
MKPVDDRPVWSIVCFFVTREARGRGLSGRMLRAAVDHARSCGARLVEASPVDDDERSDPDSMFFGTTSMFDRAGFREVARRRATRPVVRKTLRAREPRPHDARTRGSRRTEPAESVDNEQGPDGLDE